MSRFETQRDLRAGMHIGTPNSNMQFESNNFGLHPPQIMQMSQTEEKSRFLNFPYSLRSLYALR